LTHNDAKKIENKITLKSTLVVFFLPKFVVHWSLKNALKGQQRKKHLQTPSPHKALKQTLKEHRLGQHLKQRRLAIRHHQTSGSKKPELNEEQIEERGQTGPTKDSQLHLLTRPGNGLRSKSNSRKSN
jgi:hypothetical protein